MSNADRVEDEEEGIVKGDLTVPFQVLFRLNNYRNYLWIFEAFWEAHSTFLPRWHPGQANSRVTSPSA